MPEAVTTSTPCLGPYSPAVKTGNLVFVSGQLGIKDGELADGIQAQTRLCLENLKAVLEAAGTTMKNVVKCQVCLKNMDDFAKVNEVYAEFFSESKPARICVEVSRLPKDALVEIDAIAEQ